MDLSSLLTPAVILAAIGAVPGGIRAYYIGKQRTSAGKGAADVLIGVVFAVALADTLTPKDTPMLALLVGLLAGIAGTRALDAFFELAPEFVRELALGWARRIVGSHGERSLRRNMGCGDLDEPPYRHRPTNPEDMEP